MLQSTKVLLLQLEDLTILTKHHQHLKKTSLWMYTWINAKVQLTYLTTEPKTTNRMNSNLTVNQATAVEWVSKKSVLLMCCSFLTQNFTLSFLLKLSGKHLLLNSTFLEECLFHLPWRIPHFQVQSWVLGSWFCCWNWLLWPLQVDEYIQGLSLCLQTNHLINQIG